LGPSRLNEQLARNLITLPNAIYCQFLELRRASLIQIIHFVKGLNLEELEDPNYSLSRWPLINSNWNETEFDWQRFAVLMHLNHDLHVLLDISVGSSSDFKTKRVFVIELELKLI